MHEQWCAAGYEPDAFWRQTPRSYQSAMAGFARRARMDAERDVALAHATAAFGRAKRLERLDHYLKRAPRGGGKASMLERLKAIAERTRP